MFALFLVIIASIAIYFIGKEMRECFEEEKDQQYIDFLRERLQEAETEEETAAIEEEIALRLSEIG